MTRYIITFALAITLGTACSPAVWQHQQRALNATVHVTNAALPHLELAHKTALAVAKLETERNPAAIAVTTEKWAPIWKAYGAYVQAIKAWQTAIDTEGDVLSTAMAARGAFCRFHGLAVELDVELPEMPIGGACK